MSGPGDWPLGLLRLASALDRDLQRAARAAGGPARLWAAGPDALVAALGLDGAAATAAVAERRAIDTADLRRDLDARGLAAVGRPEPEFPSRLATIFDPPFGLVGRGDLPAALRALSRGPVVAMVGSRRATPRGRALAQALGRAVAERGGVVVSGLAVGIDAAAHRGALEGGGVTVAFAGCGPDVAYPRANRPLADRIAAGGAVVSEYWPGTRPARWRFPARNRLVAGAADAVVVVEAGRRSGSLITAEFAMEAGRSVLAAPGPAGSGVVAGCHALLRDGAALCESVEDVVAEIPGAAWREASSRGTAAPPEGLRAAVLDALEGGPRSVDDLVGALGAPARELAGALALLEVEGLALRGEAGAWWAAPAAGRGAG